MIPVARPEKPPGFDEDCQTPGESWLDENPDGDPHKNPLWGRYRGVLRTAYKQRCGLLGLFISEGDVDHWTSLKTNRRLAYRWDNYRYLAGVVNSAKKQQWEGKLLDPHTVGEGWFEMLIPSCLLRRTDSVPEAERDRADFTIEKVLNKPYAIELRKEWYQLHVAGKAPVATLEEVAPLVARAVTKSSADASQHHRGG